MRTALYVRASRVSVLRPLLLKKARRVPALLLGHALVALILALLAPTFLLVAGPLLLGVPHLVSDLRQLVLRPSLPRLARPLFLGGSVALLGARALNDSGLWRASHLEPALASALLLGAIALALPGARAARAVIATLVALPLVGCALAWPRESQLLLGHAHNVVALLLWAALYARGTRAAVAVALAIVALGALLVLSPLAWFGFQHGLESCFGLHALAAADTLAPGVARTELALGIVASFAFLQSVHYAVWLHAIPQAATRGDASLTFGMSFRALRADLGRWGLVVCAALALLVPCAGLVAPLFTKALYLSLASFHGYLELAAAALFFVGGYGPLTEARETSIPAAWTPG
ncbi:MAG TPA: hypothetical protein VHP33_14095 [Polyangiaceae bacterium]|nr:hypothetical protein [Polyangiaceae bacterium]